jgi:hypothetical protein
VDKLNRALEDAKGRRQPVFIHVWLNRTSYQPTSLKTWAKGVIDTNHYAPPSEFDPFGTVW